MHFSPFKGSNNQYAKHPTLSSWIKTLFRQAYNIISFCIATKKKSKTLTKLHPLYAPFFINNFNYNGGGGRGGILTSKWFLCVFLASVCPFPMCEGQVSILDHMLWIAREKKINNETIILNINYYKSVLA